MHILKATPQSQVDGVLDQASAGNGLGAPYGSLTSVCYLGGIIGTLTQAHVLWSFKIKRTI